MNVYPWPNCIDCGEPMPWIMSSKLRHAYYCEKDEKLVIREQDDSLRWFAAIYTPREIMR